MKRSKHSKSRKPVTLITVFAMLLSVVAHTPLMADESLSGLYATLEAAEDRSLFGSLAAVSLCNPIVILPNPIELPELPPIVIPPGPIIPPEPIPINPVESIDSVPEVTGGGQSQETLGHLPQPFPPQPPLIQYKKLRLTAKIVNPTPRAFQIDPTSLLFREFLEFRGSPDSSRFGGFKFEIESIAGFVPAHSTVIVAEARVEVNNPCRLFIELEVEPRYFEFRAVLDSIDGAQAQEVMAQTVWTEGLSKTSNSKEDQILGKLTRLDNAVNGTENASGIAEKVKDIDLNVQMARNDHREIKTQLQVIRTALRRILILLLRKK